MLWKTDNIEVTEVNLHSNRMIPGDTGSLMVTLGEERIRIDQWRPSVKIGRGQECDLVVNDRYASRQHLTIRLMRTRFYLIDHSSNGTFVTPQGGQEAQVLRGELLLDRSGELRLGRSRTGPSDAIISSIYALEVRSDGSTAYDATFASPRQRRSVARALARLSETRVRAAFRR